MSDYPVSGQANPAPAPTATNTSAPLVAIYWLIVLVPLGWGVYQTVQKSVPLFHVAGTPAAVRTNALPTPTISPPTVAADAPLASPAASTIAPAATSTPADSPAPTTIPASTP